MGFSLTGTHVIFFIASIIVAGAVSGVFIAVTMNVSNSFSERGDRVQEQLDTDFEIINDPNEIPTSNGYYVFYLMNTGGKRLLTTNETFHIFLDGEIAAVANYHFNDTYIQPSEVTEMHVIAALSGGSHILRVVGPQAIDDEFNFMI